MIGSNRGVIVLYHVIILSEEFFLIELLNSFWVLNSLIFGRLDIDNF